MSVENGAERFEGMDRSRIYMVKSHNYKVKIPYHYVALYFNFEENK